MILVSISVHRTGWLRLTYLVPVECQDTVLGQEGNCFLACLDPPGVVEKKRKEKEERKVYFHLALLVSCR